MATKTRRWTRADLDRLPHDGNRYEVLDGELFVTPQASVPHQWIAFQVALRIGAYVERHALGMVVGPGALIVDDNELQPDVMVVPPFSGPLPEKWELLPRAILVIEVLSGSTRRRDLHIKPPAYRRFGVRECWVIDRFGSRALIWRPGASEAEEATNELRWAPNDRVAPLVIPLEEVLPR